MNLLCNGKIPRILKVLHGIIDANKDPVLCRWIEHKSVTGLQSTTISFVIEFVNMKLTSYFDNINHLF